MFWVLSLYYICNGLSLLPTVQTLHQFTATDDFHSVKGCNRQSDAQLGLFLATRVRNMAPTAWLVLTQAVAHMQCAYGNTAIQWSTGFMAL